MSARRVQLVLLCEDNQHEAFLRRFLKSSGFDMRNVRVKKAPKPRGSAEQWVRINYPREVRALRTSHVHRALLVCIDEDTKSTARRAQVFDQVLRADEQRPRSSAEHIVHVIPERNIETWLAYLKGVDVDTTSAYPKFKRERQCKAEVDALKAMCDAGELRQPAPPSLEAACAEYRARMP